MSSLDIRYVATLARIALTEEEIGRFENQLGQVLEYVEQLKQVDVSEVEPTAHAIPMDNVFRKDDEKQEGLTREEVLANAPHAANGLFMVTKVME